MTALVRKGRPKTSRQPSPFLSMILVDERESGSKGGQYTVPEFFTQICQNYWRHSPDPTSLRGGSHFRIRHFSVWCFWGGIPVVLFCLVPSEPCGVFSFFPAGCCPCFDIQGGCGIVSYHVLLCGFQARRWYSNSSFVGNASHLIGMPESADSFHDHTYIWMNSFGLPLIFIIFMV